MHTRALALRRDNEGEANEVGRKHGWASPLYEEAAAIVASFLTEACRSRWISGSRLKSSSANSISALWLASSNMSAISTMSTPSAPSVSTKNRAMARRLRFLPSLGCRDDRKPSAIGFSNVTGEPPLVSGGASSPSTLSELGPEDSALKREGNVAELPDSPRLSSSSFSSKEQPGQKLLRAAARSCMAWEGQDILPPRCARTSCSQSCSSTMFACLFCIL
mmetsp:Transcript_55284/g.131848  ORF Transcript_55284/g.131848 Transcript_55284/m.131848 type:complete len:220 (-) Transcript_55284:879-1538(-)